MLGKGPFPEQLQNACSRLKSLSWFFKFAGTTWLVLFIFVSTLSEMKISFKQGFLQSQTTSFVLQLIKSAADLWFEKESSN